jgi:hypothetical protein
VGAPDNVTDSWLRVKTLRTVSNRLREIPEVSRMIRDADRLPQSIHEYCFELACIGEDSRGIDVTILEATDKERLELHMKANVVAIERRMNSTHTEIGPRNQVLYTVGALEDAEEIDFMQVERRLRKESKVPAGLGLNIPGLLAELASGEKPILTGNIANRRYRFADAKYRMCLRTMLKKEGSQVVLKELLG